MMTTSFYKIIAASVLLVGASSKTNAMFRSGLGRLVSGVSQKVRNFRSYMGSPETKVTLRYSLGLLGASTYFAKNKEGVFEEEWRDQKIAFKGTRDQVKRELWLAYSFDDCRRSFVIDPIEKFLFSGGFSEDTGITDSLVQKCINQNIKIGKNLITEKKAREIIAGGIQLLEEWKMYCKAKNRTYEAFNDLFDIPLELE